MEEMMTKLIETHGKQQIEEDKGTNRPLDMEGKSNEEYLSDERNSSRKKATKQKAKMNKAYYTLKEKIKRFKANLKKQFVLQDMSEMEDLGLQTRVQLPSKFKMPHLPKFKGLGDPIVHVK